MKVHDYHQGNRDLQDKFGTRRLADRMAERAAETLGEGERWFIEEANMFFLATCDKRGMPTCSYKGGDVGFVRVVDEQTLAFPNYDGNGKYQSMGNLLKNPNVGLLLIDFVNPGRLRLQGIATAHEHDDLHAEYPGAQFMVRVRVTEVYVNCPRYVHKYQLIERSVFVPREGVETPVPAWKLQPGRRSLLAGTDPARKISGASHRAE